jgi:hypothetical protein
VRRANDWLVNAIEDDAANDAHQPIVTSWKVCTATWMVDSLLPGGKDKEGRWAGDGIRESVMELPELRDEGDEEQLPTISTSPENPLPQPFVVDIFLQQRRGKQFLNRNVSQM